MVVKHYQATALAQPLNTKRCVNIVLPLRFAYLAIRPLIKIRVARVCIDRTSNQGYQEAIHHLQRVERLLAKHPAALADFYLAITSLAETYKRKRNMHSLLKKHYPKQV